jgi:hypothetical protein
MSSIEKPHTLAGTGLGVRIWADTTKLATFLSATTADTSAAAVDIAYSRAGASVHRYPGDPNPYTRRGGQVHRVKAPSATVRTLPGRPFTCEVTTGVGALKHTTTTQFTFTGPFTTLHAYVAEKCTKSFILRSPGGKPYVITKSGG